MNKKREMKQEDSIKDKYGKESGMKVPDGYFSELESRILTSLPPYQAKPIVPAMTTWQRVKPYVYLAAMFCGIWLMMKVFHTATQPMSLSLDNPPEAIVQLLDHELYPEDYISLQLSSDYDLEEEVVMSYDSFEDFEKDFESEDVTTTE